ncbi:MAG: AraC family transcriptional regulator [Rubrivivax sp.]|nr:MAG: AraC family transcriptional regulator [Rubrivivax sp.]
MSSSSSVPVSYVWLLVELAAQYGVSQASLLEGLGFPEDLLHNPDARVPLRPDYAAVCRRALMLSGEPGLGYEFGLRASLTTHGLLGYGLMSQATLRQVMAFGQRFGSALRLPAWQLQFFEEDGQVCMRATESVERNELHQFSAQQVLVSCYSLLVQLLPECRSQVALFFNMPEPVYQARYARRLPTCHFIAPFNELRVPDCFLDVPLRTADRVSAQLSERGCERELAQVQEQRQDDLVQRVHALLVPGRGGYLSADDLAAQLKMSPRTLARQLRARGTSYRAMLLSTQRRDSLGLLRDPQLCIAEVACLMGFSSVSNFGRACKEWHGEMPARLPGLD